MNESLTAAVARAIRWWVGAGIVLAVLCGGSWSALAQAPAAAPPPAAAPAAVAPVEPLFTLGDISVRLHFPLVDQFSFVSHPYYQITEDPAYANGRAAGSNIFQVGRRLTDERVSAGVKLLHALPAFGIEGVMGINLPFPRGIGWGFDFSPLSQTDVDAAGTGGNVTAIRTDTYYYSGALRFYFFNPTQPGINYFAGLGLGLIEGNMEVPTTVDTQYIHYSQYPVGSLRMGLESLGDNWGFRYELMVINAREVQLDSNPYPDRPEDADTLPPPTTIDFSGSMVRVTLFYQF